MLSTAASASKHDAEAPNTLHVLLLAAEEHVHDYSQLWLSNETRLDEAI